MEIYDYGLSQDGTYYYVMEYLPGLSLAELVERHGPLPPGRAVYLLRQVCLALREAHAAGLIHRDIKPSNIFAARRGGMDDVAKLLDFGLVRPATAAQADHLSAEGQILGTPQFMSPEQAVGAPELDERSDIYSLGAVAYYLLTGRPPFDDEVAIAVLDRARPRPGGPAVARPPRHPRRPGTGRPAMPRQVAGRSVPGRGTPGTRPGRLRVRRRVGPGSRPPGGGEAGRDPARRRPLLRGTGRRGLRPRAEVAHHGLTITSARPAGGPE